MIYALTIILMRDKQETVQEVKFPFLDSFIHVIHVYFHAYLTEQIKLANTCDTIGHF